MITLWRWANDANVANVAQCAMCNAKVANVANVANVENNVAQQQKRRGDNPEISGVESSRDANLNLSLVNI